MRRRTKGSILVAGVASVLAAGGTLTAWASWTTNVPAAPVAGSGAQLPAMAEPEAKLSEGTPLISWSKPSTALPIEKFVVTRDTGTPAVVCTVPAGTTSCLDATAPADTAVRYTVHATLGPVWAGARSDPSDPITTPEVMPPAAPKAAAAQLAAVAKAATQPAKPAEPAPAEVAAPVEAVAPKPAETTATAAVGDKPAEKPADEPTTTAPKPTPEATKPATTTPTTPPAAEPTATGSDPTSIPE